MDSLMNTPSGPVTIRVAQVEDAIRLRELRLEALLDAPVAFAADYERTAAEPVERWVQRINEYTQGNQSVIYVAEAEGKLIGMTGLGRGHWQKTEHGGVIWGVYVQPAWRGLQLAEALIEACIAWGRGLGMTVVKLGVVTSNAAAIRCYLRCGFTVYGVDPQAICYNGIKYDELLMARKVTQDH
ncbi:MAG: GNAT family N-acetyltransferase [Anaerolineales bacterium]|nr:GNAT family N-acetyltransferase [Anaerolineales bacterium]